ncbi:EbsA family protein [Enterococcus sp. CSURQ0835]|uniref:EbsA family protein n=1 Tax=Enterococcus sp. CSURQ0835 TaxID=2681394 RepID=UPI00135B53E4|nr:EbsA family protein [Enterococcus sp. CSURQ0835]
MKAKRYFWQPELSLSIIYWSVSLIILFYGLILTLENTRPYLKGNLMIGAFFLAVLIGLKRYFKITADRIELHYSRFWKKETIKISEIKKIVVGNDGLVIITPQKKRHYLMHKKSRERFVADLRQRFPKLTINYQDAKISREE